MTRAFRIFALCAMAPFYVAGIVAGFILNAWRNGIYDSDTLLDKLDD